MTQRSDAQRVTVPNEGLSVYLWDAAHLKAVKKGTPNLMGESDRRRDRELRALAQQGLLVVYELPQDDDIDVTVYVGPPLSPEELAGGAWRPPQNALLDLPSGELCIDSGNTAKFIADADAKKKSGRVHVPPGRYRLTVHRRDWTSGAPIEGPREVLTLTPTNELRWDDAPPQLFAVEPAPGAEPSAEVIDGVWRGRILQRHVTSNGEVSLAIDLDELGLEELGVRRCGQLVLEAEGRVIPVLMLGWLSDLRSTHALLGEQGVRSMAAGAPVEAYIESSMIPVATKVPGEGEWLRLRPLSGGDASPLFELPEGTRLIARAGPQYAGAAALPRPKVKDAQLQAEVLASHADGLVLSAERTVFNKLGTDHPWFEIELEGQSFQVYSPRMNWREEDKCRNLTREQELERQRLGNELASLEVGNAPQVEIARKREEFEAASYGPGVIDARPLKWDFAEHWANPKRGVMVLSRWARVQTPRFRYDVPGAPVGSVVTLTLRPR